jgi:peptide/nickel transport system substrate-binding protein
MDTPAPDTFRIFLREACGFVLEALGKPSSNVPFIMPKRIADTDAFKQIEEHIGSGPYMFVKDQFKPGDKAVYVRNPKYVPRKEAPSGSTGGKHVYVERVEWNLALRDAQAQVSALQKGEVDILEQPAFEHVPALKKDPSITVYTYSPATAVHGALQPPAQAVRQREGAAGGAGGVRAGAVPEGAGRREGALPHLPVDVHLRLAVRKPGRQRHPVEVEHEEGTGAAEDSGMTARRSC